MNCQDFETTMISMARAQLLEATACRQAIAHIAQCPACADKLAEQQALTAAVRATAKSLRDEEASAHIEQSLRAAFRKQAGAAPAFQYGSYGSFGPAHTRRWSKQALAAVAAAVLLFLLAVAIRQWPLTDRGQKTATVQPAPAPTPKERGKSPQPFFPTGKPERETVRHAASKRQPAQPDVTGSEEVVTEFIALADESEFVPLESGQMLRVELSASTLISMGLPITTPIMAEDVSKFVLADLLVGQDGQPRAIRLVGAEESTHDTRSRR
jgi:hypothetical protein